MFLLPSLPSVTCYNINDSSGRLGRELDDPLPHRRHGAARRRGCSKGRCSRDRCHGTRRLGDLQERDRRTVGPGGSYHFPIDMGKYTLGIGTISM
jgi:hypothetical protein